jgi:formyl-CoA transferase
VDGLLFQSNGQLSIGALGFTAQRWGNQFSIAAPVNTYVCTDGRVYTGVLLDSHWRVFCHHIDRQDVANLNGLERIQRRDELDAILAAWCVTRTTQEVVTTMNQLGLAVTRVNTYAEAAREPHVQARELLIDTELTDGSHAPLTAPAAKFSRTPIGIRTPAPSLGQHTESILKQLGYSATHIAELRAQRVI